MSSSTTSAFTIANLFDVRDLIVVVTGGGTGIGLMITQALASNGARVYIMGRRLDVLEKTALEHSVGLPDGAAILPVEGDTTKKESIKAALDKIKTKEKYIDILVNNSGISGPEWNGAGKKTAADIGNSLFENDYDEAVACLKTNVLGYYYTSGAFLPLLAESPNNPQIINITSNAAFGRESMAGMVYSASKAASTHLTKMLSSELRNTNVRVNAIAPGLFPSELTAGKDATDGSNKSQWKDSNDTMGIPVSKSAGGGPGTDSDMATSVLYLANKKQRYASGTILLIDGGVLNEMPNSY